MGCCCGKMKEKRGGSKHHQARSTFNTAQNTTGSSALRSATPKEVSGACSLSIASTQCPSSLSSGRASQAAATSETSESSGESSCDEEDGSSRLSASEQASARPYTQRTSVSGSTPPRQASLASVQPAMEPWGDTANTAVAEYRIRLPLSLAEFEKAQIHGTNEGSRRVTGGGNGVEVVRFEPFGPATPNNPASQGLPGCSGLYAEKIYHLRTMVPAAIRSLLSEDLMRMMERSWSAFPRAKTVVTNGKWPPEAAFIKLLTLSVPGSEPLHNALNLPPELLKLRKVIPLDIADDALLGGRKSKNYRPEEDPKLLRTWDGRGPFPKGWETGYTGPQIIVYKAIIIRFRLRFLGGRIRAWALEKSYPSIWARFHRFAVCSYDEWSRRSLATMRAQEEAINHELRNQLHRDGAAAPALHLEA